MLSQIDRMLKRLRPEASQNEEQSFPFGDLHATVRVFDDAIILHFPVAANQGVVVSLEPDAARQLTTFINRCQQQI
jgi:hypothetical protein